MACICEISNKVSSPHEQSVCVSLAPPAGLMEKLQTHPRSFQPAAGVWREKEASNKLFKIQSPTTTLNIKTGNF